MTVNYTDVTRIKQSTDNVKDVIVKSIAVLAGDSTNTVNKLILPADATLLGIQVVVPTGTSTATLSVGLLGTGTTTYISAQDLTTAGQFWPPLLSAGNLGTFPPRTNFTLTTTVGTTAVTSTVYVNVFYVR